MDFDQINDIEWFRKELKKFCVYVKKDINETFTVGNWYIIDFSEAGIFLIDWKREKTFDVFELENPKDYIDYNKERN